VFKRDGGGPLPPHDLTIGAIGAVILWFGWYGFNPGSTLSAMDFGGIGRVAANTTLDAGNYVVDIVATARGGRSYESSWRLTIAPAPAG
jgi:ammonia channel protein AmtB